MERDIKIITLGETCVGKTSLIERIVKNTFNENQLTTIGNTHFIIKKDYKKKNLILKLNFMDTAGQERFITTLPLQYMRNSHIVLLVFSNLKDLEILKNRWYEYYKENCNIGKSKFIIVGNKSDIFGKDKAKIKEEGNKFAEDIDAFFITCSAKSEDNIENLEAHILTEAKRLIDEEEKKDNQSEQRRNTHKLNQEKIKKKRGCYF